MARVTVEDCIQKISNRFELVLLAAHRSRLIRSDADAEIPGGPVRPRREKKPTRALRDIARKDVDVGAMREECITALQKLSAVEDVEREADQRALAATPELSEADALRAYQAESDAARAPRR